MGAVLTVLTQAIYQIGSTVASFANWFYLSFLPYILNYIGIPLFLLGIILALAFIFGNALFFVLLGVLGYFFVKSLIFVAPVTKQMRDVITNVNTSTLTEQSNKKTGTQQRQNGNHTGELNKDQLMKYFRR